MVDLVSLVVQVIVAAVVLAPVLWFVGRIFAGKDKAKFTDALWIAVLGVIIGAIIGAFLPGWVSWIIMIIVWLFLISHFFDCSWLKALLIAIVAVIIYIIIIVILGAILLLLGLGALGALF
jgi:hypothetical protein